MSDDAWVMIDKHWCLTEDGKRVVPETDTEARWLHWTPGTLVSREEAERLGAVEPVAEPKKAAAPVKKAAAAPPNKMSRPPQNKGR
ncbi:hypothetical protein [Streptomyces chartreusis]